MQLFGRPKHKRMGNIKMDLKEIECDSVEWINLASDREQLRTFVNTIMNFQFP